MAIQSAFAVPGDTVRHVTSRRVGTVTGITRSGRLVVKVRSPVSDSYGKAERWERWERSDTELMGGMTDPAT